MPTYTIMNTKTKKKKTEFMSIAEMEALPPHLRVVISAPKIISGRQLGRQKPDANFRDLLKNIKQHNPGANFNSWD